MILRVFSLRGGQIADFGLCMEQPAAGNVDELDAQGAMTVQTDSANFYRYFDATAAAEYLYASVERTIDTDLREELEFLGRYDAAWRTLRETVDMPDRKLELFIKLCFANHGRLSASKRNQFRELSDEEVELLEEALRAAGL